MKQIDELNYVDTAEKVIQDLKQENRNKISLTTSKIRNLLSMTAALYTDAQKHRGDKLSEEIQIRVQYLRMRVAYDAGRDENVTDFVTRAEIIKQISAIHDSRKNLLLFCRYMEALVAYHKFYGGRD